MPSEIESAAIKGLDKLYEFEREPVSENKLHSGKYFAGVYAGEHVAGTEFVIGALFVAWGATAYNIFVGLLLGNLMAVLTWVLVCAPIAVRTRLTLYWYLRKIAGPVTTTIYNILNAILFCILAGCMITVSASAIRIPFKIPEQTGWVPTDVRFAIVAICVGVVVVALAILGFKKLAQFSEVCSPWMFLMFIAGAIAIFPTLAKNVLGGQMGSFAQFWEIANKAVWTGTTPDGQPGVSFWRVTAFAWICNLAMHGGLSDMALLRYARRASYGLYSAFGMFLGHYLAWICAGIMGATTALIVGKTMAQLDAGGVAYEALGVTGIITVVIAGWTTSNPTLYRAGLAFQAVTPGWPRWLVTLVAGAATTAIACSPFVFTKLLGFVGLYGLLLMPVGAIVFVEHWIFPKIGLTQLWVSKKKLAVSWPALASWGIAMLVAVIIQTDSPLVGLLKLMRLQTVADFVAKAGFLHLFFLFIPVWLLTAVLYILFASMAGAREKFPDQTEDQPLHETPEDDEDVTPVELPDWAKKPKKADPVLWICAIIAIASLAACFILSIWVYRTGGEDYQQNFEWFKNILIVPTIIYFITGTVWVIKRDKTE